MTLLPADLSPQEPTQAKPGAAETMRPELVGTHGIVAGGRHLSVAAGIRVLQESGADVRRKRYAFGW